MVRERKYGTSFSGWSQQLVSRIRVPGHAPLLKRVQPHERWPKSEADASPRTQAQHTTGPTCFVWAVVLTLSSGGDTFHPLGTHGVAAAKLMGWAETRWKRWFRKKHRRPLSSSLLPPPTSPCSLSHPPASALLPASSIFCSLPRLPSFLRRLPLLRSEGHVTHVSKSSPRATFVLRSVAKAARPARGRSPHVFPQRWKLSPKPRVVSQSR